MDDWRLAKSLIKLRAQVDARWPDRDRSTDGDIGDAAHQSRESDHNPNAADVVTAIDIDRDIAPNFKARDLAEALVASRDPRIKYIISNRQIVSSKVSPWVWRPYDGDNAHSEHCHVSVGADPALYDDDRDWIIPGVPVADGSRRLKLGDVGGDVARLQTLLGVPVDGEFGPTTDSALRTFQASHGLEVDGIAGPQTWAALMPTTRLAQVAVDKIIAAARTSVLARVEWTDRGRAPIGYINGMAVAFGEVYSKLKAGDVAASFMARAANINDTEHDALAWYQAVGISAGVETLIALFKLLIGLGMRESSGRYCEGRDQSAQNVAADTAEAGLFQQSWDSHSASSLLTMLLSEYAAKPNGGLFSIFSEGVTPRLNELENYGSGDGEVFQRLCKSKPLFAVESAAVGLRVLRKHWGPINRREVEVRFEADMLLRQVKTIVDAAESVMLARDDSALIIVKMILEDETMDEATRNLLIGELSRTDPDIAALLQKRLTALPPPQPIPQPLPPRPVAVPQFDFAKFLPLLQEPVIRKLISGQSVTIIEFMPLIPKVIALFNGQPIAAAPIVVGDTTAPIDGAAVQPNTNILATAIAALGAAGTAMTTGHLGTPLGMGQAPTQAGTFATMVPIIVGAISSFGGFTPIVKFLGGLFGGRK